MEEGRGREGGVEEGRGGEGKRGRRGREGGGEERDEGRGGEGRGREGGMEEGRGREGWRGTVFITRMSNELLNLSFCSYKRKELLANIANIRNFKACNIQLLSKLLFSLLCFSSHSLFVAHGLFLSREYLDFGVVRTGSESSLLRLCSVYYYFFICS